MGKPFRVWKDIYLIGDSELTHPADCCVYVIDAGDLVVIDSGAGQSFEALVSNIQKLGLKAERIKAVIATHSHIDHIGSLWHFREKFGCKVIAHELDARAIETGSYTGAEFYGLPYHPCPVDIKLKGQEDALNYGPYLKALHIPGHTPGSIALYMDREKRVLFGQDVHGPYSLRGADPAQARASLNKLIALEADILCEGHFGIYQPKEKVRSYIEGCLSYL